MTSFSSCDIVLVDMRVKAQVLATSLLTGFLLNAPAAAGQGASELRSGVRRLPSVPAAAPPNSCQPSAVQAPTALQCENGVVVDDGTVENGLSFTADTVDLVMLLDVGVTDALIEEVCVCWTRGSASGPEVNVPFEIVFYAEALNGEPGELLEVIPGMAADVPDFPDSRIYRFDVTAEDFRSPDERLFVGVSWFANDEPEFFVCTDLDGPNRPPIFVSDDLGATWVDRRLGFSDIQALVIRVTTDNDIFKNGFESGDLSAWTVPGSV